MMLLPIIAAGLAQAPITLRVQADQPSVAVNPGMYGIFFEEINQAGEGGLYAELLRTRGMEDGDKDRLPSGWKSRGGSRAGAVTLDSTESPDPSRPRSLKISRTGDAPMAAVNEGFWGIPVKKGEAYRLTLWVRAEVPLAVSLEGSDRKGLADTRVECTKGQWRRVATTLRPQNTDAKAKLSIAPASAGTVHVAFCSLMPTQTWKGRPNGLRKDLAEKIDAIKPGFVRFPGGCFVEGHDLAQAFDWKKSLGPLETRPAMPRILWGYPSSNGMGFHEYLQWCEDLGAKALFVVNCGMSHSEVAAMPRMNRYVQDALDAIEYARGPVTSKWGALRAKHGHPKPFNLRYIQIGNENGGPNYDERYALMGKAIKQAYPDIQLVANVWGGVPKSFPLEIIDEHYYNNPEFFWRNANRYDTYDRKGPKIYVGEYAVTRGCGNGNLAAALGEAAFMTGMERNADIVHMASYAPLFANVNNRQWNPNAVVFDATRSYGTPSYWVQQMFASNRPTRALRTTANAPATTLPPFAGRVGLQTWRTSAEFRDIELEVDGRKVLATTDVTPNRVEIQRGDWKIEGGQIRQNSLDEDRRALLREVEVGGAKRVVLRLKARKLAGAEGFIIMFAVGPSRELQWNLGGWQNTVHAFQSDGERTGKGVEGRIETNRWYDIRLEREGAVTRGYLDGVLVEEIRDVPSADFAAVAGIDEKANEIIIKAVNGSAQPRTTELDLQGARVGGKAKGWVLSSANLADENSLERPDQIRPKPFNLAGVRPRMNLTLAPYSVTVLRIPRR